MKNKTSSIIIKKLHTYMDILNTIFSNLRVVYENEISKKNQEILGTSLAELLEIIQDIDLLED